MSSASPIAVAIFDLCELFTKVFKVFAVGFLLAYKLYFSKISIVSASTFVLYIL